jgi:hypothetical protein
MLKKPSGLMIRALGTPAVGSGRNQRRLRQGRPGIESLEERALMSAFDESGDALGLSRAAVNSARLVQKCPSLGRSWFVRGGEQRFFVHPSHFPLVMRHPQQPQLTAIITISLVVILQLWLPSEIPGGVRGAAARATSSCDAAARNTSGAFCFFSGSSPDIRESGEARA